MGKLSHIITRPFRYTHYRYSVVYVLIAINIAVFVLISLFPTLLSWVAMNPNLVLQGRIWTLVTYMFHHGGISHLFFNMLGLYFFGHIIERLWGSDEFLCFYGVVGTLSGVCSFIVYVLTGATFIWLIGASGAIYGILLVFASMFPERQIYVFGIFPLKAKLLIIIFIGIQIFSIITSNQSGIAYFTHLSGIAVAWVYLYIRHKINPYKRLFSR